MGEHPDVAELLAYNKAACKHEHVSRHTRWLGGRPGMIGGQRPEDWWFCDDCREWARPFDFLQDTEDGRALVAKLSAMQPPANTTDRKE